MVTRSGHDACTGNPRSVALYRRRGYREAGQVFFPRRTLPFYCFERAPAPDAPGDDASRR